MRLLVTRIVSVRDFGVILQGTVLSGKRKAESIRVKAQRSALCGDPVVGETWDVDGTTRRTVWGPQVDASRAARVLPTGALICDFLAAHVPGVGALRARRLWEHFGPELTDILASEDGIEAIARVIARDRPILGPRLAALMVRTWRDAAGEAALIDWLSTRGVEDVALVRRLARLLGPDAAERLARNPYCLVSLMPWSKVDALGVRVLAETGATDPYGDARRLVGAVDATVRQALARGDTALTSENLRAGVARALASRPASARVAAALAAGERNGAVIRMGALWRAPGAATLEQGVSDRLTAMLSPGYPDPVGVSTVALERVLDLVADGRPKLHFEQRAAVLAVLRNPASCLTGGAGVGKTHTTRAVCDLWAALGGRLVLCALAGKAALRLSRATGRPARSLARTLGELARRETLERRLREEDLDGAARAALEERLEGLAVLDERTLVVVDEASMVGLPTMHALLRRMPRGARLLLVGDAAQLPPVEFGLVYQGLVRDPSLTTRLSTVHRQAADTGIPAVAAEIRAGRVPSLPPYDGCKIGVSLIACEPDEIAGEVERVYRELTGSPGEALIVTATNRGPFGVDALNARLHEAHVDAAGAPEVRGHLGRSFSEGEPVIHLRNDYGRGLFNGLMGRITALDLPSRGCTVQFDGEVQPHVLATNDLLDLSLAYAVTCHRAQGSSAPRVIIPLQDSPGLDQSWLYTAVTRSEVQVVLVGDAAAMERALRRGAAADRRLTGFDWRDTATGRRAPPHAPVSPIAAGVRDTHPCLSGEDRG